MLNTGTDDATSWRLPELPPNSEIWIRIWSYIEGRWHPMHNTRQSGAPGSGLPFLIDDFFSVLPKNTEVPDGKLSIVEIKNPQGLTNAIVRIVPDQKAALTRITPSKKLDISGANETINISIVESTPEPGNSPMVSRLGLNVSQSLSEMVAKKAGFFPISKQGSLLTWILDN